LGFLAYPHTSLVKHTILITKIFFIKVLKKEISWKMGRRVSFLANINGLLYKAVHLLVGSLQNKTEDKVSLKLAQ
jgi:hypothetical protein